MLYQLSYTPVRRPRGARTRRKPALAGPGSPEPARLAAPPLLSKGREVLPPPSWSAKYARGKRPPRPKSGRRHNDTPSGPHHSRHIGVWRRLRIRSRAGARCTSANRRLLADLQKRLDGRVWTQCHCNGPVPGPVRALEQHQPEGWKLHLHHQCRRPPRVPVRGELRRRLERWDEWRPAALLPAPGHPLLRPELQRPGLRHEQGVLEPPSLFQ